MQITLLTTEEEIARAFDERRGQPSGDLSVDSVSERPGAAGGWYEIVLAWGALGVPAAVAANLISQFLWEMFQRRKKPLAVPVKLKVVLRDGDKATEVDLESADPDAIRTVLETALTTHANRAG